jgi:hypothetical protein
MVGRYPSAGPGLVQGYEGGDAELAAPTHMSVTVEQTMEPPGVVDLIRFDQHDTRPTAVRGQAAVVGEYRAGTPASWTFVRWRDEASGLLITVSGYHVGEADVRRVAESLRPGDADDLTELDRQRATSAADQVAADARSRAEIDWAFGAAPEVASGEHDGARWTLSAVDVPNVSCTVPRDFASPCLVLSVGDDRGQVQAWQYPGEPSPLSMGIALEASGVPIAVVGSVPADLSARVSVELPGRAPVHPSTRHPGDGPTRVRRVPAG